MASGNRIQPSSAGVRVDDALVRPPSVEITVDGMRVQACPGESIAAALLVAGRRALRMSPRLGLPRGAFCMMGACQECLVQVDGRLALACQTPVRAGMRVETGGAGGCPISTWS
jgi:predicted molibdopterin-dependent oxidoreductase YjgC